jgi:predicted nucleic acid-binding Zn ribbon protein
MSGSGGRGGPSGTGGTRRPRRRRTTPQQPPTAEDWTVADDDEPTLTRVEGPTALAGELARLTRRPGWNERLGAARVWAAWEDIVGPELIAHCEPVRLAGRVLAVRAATPAWATQLRYLTGQLIERSDSVLGPGSVREVRIVVGRLEGQPDGRAGAGTVDRPDGSSAARRPRFGHAVPDPGRDPDDPGPDDPEVLH